MPKSKSSEQAKRFEEKARELGCNDDEAVFDSALKRISNAQPPTVPRPKPKKTKTPAK